MRLLFASLLAILLGSQIGADLYQEWDKFKRTFDVKYKSLDEEYKRFKIFEDNLKEIEEHNALYDAGLSTYRKGVNQFTDKTAEEFQGMLGKILPFPSSKRNATMMFSLPKDLKFGESINWTSEGADNEIRDQGSCGSCWAHAAVEAVESRYFIVNRRMLTLSTQALVDCAGLYYGNNGCCGGMIENAFEYMIEKGVMNESDYKYTAVDGRTCRYDESRVVFKLKGFASVPSDIKLMKSALYIGPLAAAVNTTGWGSYRNGIFHPSPYISTGFDHAVVIVGYGSENGTDFWIIRNSWGKSWGERGYMRLAIDGTAYAGLHKCVSQPIID